MSTVIEKEFDLYDQDFYAWTNKQASLLRSGRLELIDLEHLAEEVESMGNSEKREFLHRLAVLFTHLLKWQYQPALRSRSWEATIDEQRDEIRIHLKGNPSLKSRIPETMEDAYRLGIHGAVRETGLAKTSFLVTCPWDFEHVMDDTFWPN